MPKHYTKNEIDLMHKPMNDKLDKILEQTTKHNNRMGKMEQWRSYITGGLAVLVIIIIPLLLWSLSQLVGVESKFEKVLSAYEVIIE